MRSPASFLKTGSASSSGESAYRSPTSSRKLSRELDHVLPAIPVLGELGGTSAQGAVPREERPPEVVHLVADVVDVILADDLVAGELQDPREGVPYGGAAAVADVKRSGRVGRHELEVDGLPLAGLRGAEPGALLQGDREDFPPELLGENDVDEPRAGDRKGREPAPPVLVAQRRHDLLRHRPRLSPETSGELHRRVGGEIPMGLLPGDFEGDGNLRVHSPFRDLFPHRGEDKGFDDTTCVQTAPRREKDCKACSLAPPPGGVNAPRETASSPGRRSPGRGRAAWRGRAPRRRVSGAPRPRSRGRGRTPRRRRR